MTFLIFRIGVFFSLPSASKVPIVYNQGLLHQSKYISFKPLSTRNRINITHCPKTQWFEETVPSVIANDWMIQEFGQGPGWNFIPTYTSDSVEECLD